MGVTLNRRKTGTVRITKEPESSILAPSLPVGEIRWGFLVMDPSSGRFIIDQDMVDTHILEFERQLAEKDKSVFSWIQTWNTYAGTFFRSNFGTAANRLGQEHVDLMLSTMTRIQKRIFNKSNVVEYLKKILHEKSKISNVPDGFLHCPTSLVGLELQNPFIGLGQVRNAVFENPVSVLDDFFEAEASAYRQAKSTFDNGKVNRHGTLNPNFRPIMVSISCPWKNARYIERNTIQGRRAVWLQSTMSYYRSPGPEDVDISVDEDVILERLEGTNEYDEGYMKWVALLHGPDMMERSGGLKIVEKGLLDMGMVTLFRSGRVNWQG